MQTFMKYRLLMILLVFAVCSQVSAAPMFPDVPEQHWARDAVADLAAKGVLEGYPDGTFKGDRAATRWEMAVALQRLLAKVEAQQATFATRADLEAIRALAGNLRDELDALGVRVRNIEDNVGALESRTTELERIRFYGFVQGNVVTMGFPSNWANVGTRVNPGVDWTNGRLLSNGTAVTNLAKLGLLVRISEESNAGVEFAAYTSLGDELLSSYWGVTPPYLSNPFTGTGSINPWVQPDNMSPWTRMTLDRVWYRHLPTNTTVVLGSFANERTDRLVLHGQRNPNINPPEILPFYGISVKGNLFRNPETPWSYEVNHSRMPSESVYETHMLAGTLRYAFDRGTIRVHGLMSNERVFADGVYIPPGSPLTATLPRYPLAPGNAIVYWRNAFGDITNPQLGTQRMRIYGLDADYQFNEIWSAYAKGAVSYYIPDTTNTMYTETATGTAVVGGIRARYGRLNGNLQYQYVSNKYDPYILQYPGNLAGIPVFLPFSTYYSEYYQLHDYLSYPSNRQGGKLELGYTFTPNTRADLNAGYLRQVAPSTLANFTTVGNIEPLFPYLQTAGSTVRGHIFDWGARVTHRFDERWQAGIGYNNFLQRRNTVPVDDINLRQDLAHLNITHNISPNVTLAGNFHYIRYRGHLGLANVGFRQYIPSLSAEATVSRNTRVGLTYRHYIYRDSLLNDYRWRANQLIFSWKVDF